MDPVVQVNEANEIVRKILAKKSVSDDEFRYAVMFNLTAMTQLLWELSNHQAGQAKSPPRGIVEGSESKIGGGRLKSKAIGLGTIAALAAFLAGIGLGYALP